MVNNSGYNSESVFSAMSNCGSEMRVISVIQDKPVINEILKSVGEPTKPPALSPARGPPSWDDYNQGMPNDDVGEQSIPGFEFNQCVSW